jgi:dipeptidyl aminopeptidase/acylaminoacyl peptidase
LEHAGRPLMSFWRWRAGIGVVGLLAVALPPAYVGTRSYRSERQNFVASPPSWLLNRPEATGIPRLRTVSFSRGDEVRLEGWFVPSRNRATIVLLHGTNADRAALLWEARALADAGFGVLAFDWPGYGLSGGDVHWGADERDALKAALDWLGANDLVDRHRIGAYGFSNGGYVLAQVAAEDTRLRAVVLAATPTDMIEQARWEYRRYGPFSQIPATWALRRSGMPVHDDPPLTVIGAIAPRPVLLIGGGSDGTVPASMVTALYRAAREPKELWIVPDAHHGHYDSVAPAEYQARLIDFFSRALLD